MNTTNFTEITQILKNLPQPNTKALQTARTREAKLTKPPKSLGTLEQITEWYATWSKYKPITHPRLAIFAANHGITNQNVSAFPQSVTKQMVANFQTGGAAINQLCGLHNMDLKVYELNLDQPTQDFSQKPAMTEQETCTAIAYGMTCVDENIDILCLGEMGIGNTTTAAAINHALFGDTAKIWVGAGTGVEGDALQNKINIVEKSVKLHKANMTSALTSLQHVGGFEIAAMLGAIIAARMGQIPVILDGYVCCAAASIAHKLGEENNINLLDHCIVGHLSAENAHAKLCQKINKEPLLNLNMRLGEGSGAAIAFSIVQAAIACHFGMATFEDAGVSEAV